MTEFEKLVSYRVRQLHRIHCVISETEENAGTQFDPDLVRFFLGVLSERSPKDIISDYVSGEGMHFPLSQARMNSDPII